MSITLGKQMFWEDPVYFIHFVHLLEGEVIQIFRVCDEEVKMFSLLGADGLWHAIIQSLVLLSGSCPIRCCAKEELC